MKTFSKKDTLSFKSKANNTYLHWLLMKNRILDTQQVKRIKGTMLALAIYKRTIIQIF